MNAQPLSADELAHTRAYYTAHPYVQGGSTVRSLLATIDYLQTVLDEVDDERKRLLATMDTIPQGHHLRLRRAKRCSS